MHIPAIVPLLNWSIADLEAGGAPRLYQIKIISTTAENHILLCILKHLVEEVFNVATYKIIARISNHLSAHVKPKDIAAIAL